MLQNKEQLTQRKAELMADIKPLAEKVKKKVALSKDEEKDLAQYKEELAEVDELLVLLDKAEAGETAKVKLAEAEAKLKEAQSKSTLKPSEMEFDYEVGEKDKNGVHLLLHSGAYFDDNGNRKGETFVQIYTESEARTLALGLNRFPFSIEKILHDPYGDVTRAVEEYEGYKAKVAQLKAAQLNVAQ